MATWELQLVSRIVRTGDLNSIMQWGITPDDFLTNEGRALFSSIQSYHSMPEHAGSVLGPYAVQRMFPNFQLCDDTSMSTEALCHEVRKQRLSTNFKAYCQQALELCEFDPTQAISQMQTGMIDLQNVGLSANKTDIHFHTAFDRVMQKYELMKQGVDMSCGTWPWFPLQEATLGLQPDDYVVIYGRPKCVPVGTEILTATGEFKRIEEATTAIGMGTDQRLAAYPIEHRTEVVVKRVVRITTRSGYELTVGENHPILRPDLNYTEAGNLCVGDHVGVARSIPTKTSSTKSPTHYELLGLLTGDGNYTRNEVQFTSADADVWARVAHLVSPKCKITRSKTSPISGRIVRAIGASNEILDTLRAEGMWGKKAENKSAPKSLFTEGQDCVAGYLGGLLTADGGVYAKTVRWNTSSRVLAKQIKHLLLRLGVVGVLSSVTTNIGTTAYVINVQAQEQHSALLEHLGPYISSEYKLEKLIDICGRKQSNKRHDDSIPKTQALETAILAAVKSNGRWPKLWGKFSKNKLFRRSGKISRALLRSLAKAMNAPELLIWADSNIRWEPIINIEELGNQDCIDIGVEGVHNFLVGDVVTHNSMKSWVLAYLICWFYEMGKRMIIYTKEMTADNIFQRAGACLAAVRYQEFRTAKLSPEEESSLYAIRRLLHHAQQSQTVVCLSAKDTTKGGDTVPWLRSKIETYRPDVCFVDGMYLMTDTNNARKDNDRVRNISRALRQMVLDTGVPSICTVQANRNAAKNQDANLDEIAFSDAISQDATLLMRCINEKNSPHIALVLGGASREFHLEGFRIYGIPAVNFNYAGELSAKEIEKAKEQDANTEDTPKKAPAKRNPLATESKAMNQTIVRLDKALNGH